MPIIITPIVTPGLTSVDTVARCPLGTMVVTDQGGMAEYCYAMSELSQYAAVLIYEQFTAQMVTTTLAQDAGSGKKIGFAQVSVPSAYYGWIHRQGVVVVNLADDCADNLPLFTTATSGVLDDATVSNCLVLGVILPVTASLATALTCIAGLPAIVAPYTNPA